MKLVLMQSAQSKIDDENRIEGWSNEGLSFKGVDCAHDLAKKVAALNVDFGIVYTSILKRAEETLKIVKEVLGVDIKTRVSFKLNERHFGVLERKNKDEVLYMYGKEKIDSWYKSFDSKPPELVITDERFPGNDPAYANILKYELPLSESFKDTYERVIDYFENEISNFLRIGEAVLLIGHEYVIKSIVKYLEDINDEDVENLEIKRDEVIVFELDDDLKVCEKKII